MTDAITTKRSNEPTEKTHDDSLEGALIWLLDDLTDMGENRPASGGDEFDSVVHARRVLRFHTEGWSVLNVNQEYLAGPFDSESEAEKVADRWVGAHVVRGNRSL
jgi:hypothetical protein